MSDFNDSQYFHIYDEGYDDTMDGELSLIDSRLPFWATVGMKNDCLIAGVHGSMNWVKFNKLKSLADVALISAE